MARAVLVVSRQPNQRNRLDAYRDVLNRNLAGNNIEPRAAWCFRSASVASALLNPNATAHMAGASIAVGALVTPGADWHVPGAAMPDGSFALLRVDDAFVELATDCVGSRTLWYVLTDQELIASTSQRAIVTLLGSFEPSRDVIPWMLSSGTLGPTGAWDARIQRLQAGERVVLDRMRWRLTSTTLTPDFAADERTPRARHLERLREAVTDICRRWSFDGQRWVLTLSGGADSRSLLCLLRDRGIETVTWGMPRSTEQDGNDARIARLLAQSLGVRNRFFAIESAESPDVVLDRFLAAGEGRVDRVAGYLDGFQVWKTLFDEGREGVIRGDEAFGSVPVWSAQAARNRMSLTTLADFFPAQELAAFELPAQTIPPTLQRRDGETLSTWRDRLYQQFRLPTLHAGLTDLKTAYVEVCNPLLARSVLDCVRALPDDLRTEKRLWCELVNAQLPNVALATRVAIPSLSDFLADSRVLEHLLGELSSDRASNVLSPLLRASCCNALRTALRTAAPPRKRERERERSQRLMRAVPAPLRNALRYWRTGRPTLEPLTLAFRAFIASRMQSLLRDDAAARPATQQTMIQPAISA